MATVIWLVWFLAIMLIALLPGDNEEWRKY